MELDLTSDQELLRETTARFAGSACPLTVLRELIGAQPGYPADYLTGGAALGWFAMLVPDGDGGGSVSGRGLCDLAVVAEERGRTLQPGPFVGMNVVAAALGAVGSSEQRAAVLPGLCAGETVATWVPGDAGVGAEPGATVTASRREQGFTVAGRAGPILGAGQADWLLVSAGGAGGLSQFLVERSTPGVTVAPHEGLDLTQRFAAVSFDEVAVPAACLVGAAGGGGPDAEHQLQVACVLTAAETVGAMDALFELTRRYAIDRTAFGRPIGSFQAVKHQLADMSLSLESSKAVATAAVRAVQDDTADAGAVVSMAASWVADAGVDIVQGCAQIFAGIGFTWEHDLHLYLRRITMNGLLYGHPDWHRARIWAHSGLGAS